MSKGFQTFQKKITTFREMASKAFQRGAPQTKELDGEKATVKIRTTPVCWGIPFDELGFSRFTIFFVKHANFMPWDSWSTSVGTYIGKARNNIHRKYYHNGGKVPYLMMLDSDILFPPDLVDTLMAHHLPIVGGWYKDKNATDHHPVVYDYEKDENGITYWKHRDKPGTGLERVDGMGAGCWLMTREVAEVLGEEPYETFGGGEDMKLCRKLMELNIPLHVDWSINLAHAGVGIY